MPITITKRILSGSTHGQPISVSATQGATPITIHQLATSATSTIDEVYLYAHNLYSEAALLTIELGASTTQNHIKQEIPAQDGVNLVLPGLLLTGSASGIYAFVGLRNTATGSLVASSGFVHVTGYVNRMVQT